MSALEAVEVLAVPPVAPEAKVPRTEKLRTVKKEPGQTGAPGQLSTMRVEGAPANDDEPGQAGAEPGFELVEMKKGRRNGVYWNGVNKDGEPLPPVWICSALHVKANTRDEQGFEWGRLLEWKDRDRRTHRWAMPCEMLAGSGEELRTVLLRRGVDITNNANERRRLADYITSVRPEVTARAVERTGWHGAAFVLPHKTLGDSPTEPIHYQAQNYDGIKLGTAGTISAWVKNVSIPCIGNSRLVLAIAASFAAPCLGLLEVEGGGVHFRGSSSGGKSTALFAASSVWGPRDYIRSWRSTDNALEGVAVLHSDLLLCLDEIGELPAKVAGATAYMLANGAGKGRARRDGSARPAAHWRLLFLSSGEIGLAELIAEAGGRIHAGQEVRVIEVPADPGAGMGVFENVPHGVAPGEFAELLAEQSRTYYGHAGMAFVDNLTRSRAQRRIDLRAARDAIAAKLIGKNESGQVRRVAQRFALIAAAGELATEWGLTGWQYGEAEKAALVCFESWLNARGTKGSSEPAAILAQVRKFLSAHGESRFSHWDPDPKDRDTINRAGFKKSTADGHEYFILAEMFKTEVCAGFDYRQVSKVLIAAGALKPDSDGSATRKERLPEIGNTRCYHITPKIWSDTDA